MRPDGGKACGRPRVRGPQAGPQSQRNEGIERGNQVRHVSLRTGITEAPPALSRAADEFELGEVEDLAAREAQQQTERQGEDA